jgi:hypothetical protein
MELSEIKIVVNEFVPPDTIIVSPELHRLMTESKGNLDKEFEDKVAIITNLIGEG